MRKISLPLVVALSASVSACDMSPSDEDKPSQRDVYSSLEDCIADWGDTALCERQMSEAREHELKMAQANRDNGGGSAAFVPLFFGPSYYGDSRAVDYNGRTYAPATSRASRTAFFTPNKSTGTITRSYMPPKPPTPTAKPSIFSSTPRGITSSTTSASRGGFGSTGGVSSGS